MKKRLLITSIVMMLVVAVALSTATYAWFTSNANVTASNINVTAATSNAPALTIAWTGGAFGTKLENINAPVAFYPIAPTELTTVAAADAYNTEHSSDPEFVEKSASLASQVYYNATIRTENNAVLFNAQNLATWVEESAANNATPYYLSTGTGEGKVETITLKNDSTSNALGAINFSADITGSAANLIRIAVYKHSGGAWSLIDVLGYNYTYTAAEGFVEGTQYYEKVRISGVDYYKTIAVANSAAYSSITTAQEGAKTLYTRDEAVTAATATYGEVTANKVVNTMGNYTCKTTFDVGGLAAQATMELKVVIWMDGLALNDDTATFAGVVNLKFAA